MRVLTHHWLPCAFLPYQIYSDPNVSSALVRIPDFRWGLLLNARTTALAARLSKISDKLFLRKCQSLLQKMGSIARKAASTINATLVVQVY